jgi:DnaJ-class molecular chaperone
MNPPLARSSILQPLNLGIRRSFGSKYPKVNENNPFDILGIPKASSYQEVKRRFVELALKHHPDLSDEQGDSTEFVRVRQAFEMIRETEDGRAKLSSAGDGSGWSDEEFQAWFFEETGHQDLLFRMDRATRKEVVEVANSQSQGGLDRGGMWEMARSMAEQEESLRKKKGDFRGTIGIDSDEKGKPAASPRRRRRK